MLRLSRSKIAPIILIALVIRLAVVLTAVWINEGYSQLISVDSGRYLMLAEKLAKGEFSLNGLPWWPADSADVPEIFRTPGYPLFLFACMHIGDVELISVYFQIALSCLTVYLVFELGTQLFGNERTGRICAAIYAVEPLSVFYCSQLLTETLFSALILLFLRYFVGLLRTGDYVDALLAGVMVAAATYVRPISYFLPLIMTMVVMGGLLFKRISLSIALRVVFFFCLAIGLMLPWQLRNFERSGFIGFSSVLGCVSYWDYRPAVIAMVENKHLNDVKKDQRNLWEKKSMRRWSQIKQYEYMKSQARRTLLSHPLEALRLFLRRSFGTLFNPGVNNYLSLLHVGEISEETMDAHVGPGSVGWSGGVLNSRFALLSKLSPAVLIFYGVFGFLLLFTYVMAVFGLTSRESLGRIEIIAIMCMACYLLSATGPVGYSRFRHPVMPLVCIFAGHGLIRVSRRRRRFRAGPRSVKPVNR